MVYVRGEVYMQDILERIAKADTYDTDMIFQAALERKRKLFPGWEIVYCAEEKEKIKGPEELIRSMWEFEGKIWGRGSRE